MYELSLSARILQFPRMCCCCGRANSPDCEYTATSTRVTGVRVIRHDTRRWAFPLCADCGYWIQAVRRIPPPYNGAALWSLFGLSITSMVVAALLALGEIDQRRVPLIGCGLGFTAAAFAILSYGLNSTLRKKHNRLRTRRRDAADDLLPDPACRPRPVEYLGWRGSVHTFLFSNPKFFNAFAVANHKKVVR